MPAFDQKSEQKPNPFLSTPAPQSEAKTDAAAKTPALDLSALSWLTSIGFMSSTLQAMMTRADGLTTQERGGNIGWSGGPTVDVESKRRTEVDENHVMESAVRMGYADQTVYGESARGGTILNDEGAQVTDQKTRRIEAGAKGVAVAGSTSVATKHGDDHKKTEAKHAVGYGPDGARGEISRSEETGDGINTHRRDAGASYGEGGLKVSTGSVRHTKVDDDHQMGQSTRATYEDGRATFNHKKESRIKDDELTGVVNSESKSTTVSVGRGGPAVERKHGTTTEVDGQTFSEEKTYGYKDGQVHGGRSKSRTYQNDDGQEQTDSSSTTGALGRDGASINHGVESKRQDGSSTASNVGGNVDWSQGTATATASHSRTSANGTQVSAGGSATINKNGELTDAQAELGMGNKKTGTSVSVHAGYHVTAGEPVKRGGVWVVSWERSISAGGKAGKSGGRGGVSVKGEAEHKDLGTRVFHSQEEADHFAKHAASLLPTDQPDPGTVAGALAMEIGESRGHSDGLSGGVGVTGRAGVASAGVSAERGSVDGTTIERVSPNVFLVTVASGESSGLSGQVGVGGVTAGGYSESASNQSQTLRFDLSTAEGQAAFESYNRTHQIPKKGAKVISQTEAEQRRSGTRLNYGAAGSASFNSTTFDSTTYDESGKTDVHGGSFDQSIVSKIPFMKGHDNMGVSLVGVEKNDKDRSYVLQGSVDSSGGSDSRKHLAQITGMRYDTSDDREQGGIKSSGKWRVDVNFTAENADEFMAAIEDEKVRSVSVFESGPDHRNNLRKALKNAHTSDDRMKAIAGYVAKDGFEGDALDTMRQVLFGQANSGLDNHFLGNFDYDLKLEGDKNFRGVEGRVELEHKIAGYQKLMSVSEASSATLVGSLNGELEALRKQRAEIANPKRYTDLPEELRAQQVAKWDMYIETLAAMRRQAALAATRNNPGSTPTMEEGEALDREVADAQAGGGDPRMAQLRKLRHQISMSDDQISVLKMAYGDLRHEASELSQGKAGIDQVNRYKRQHRTIRDTARAAYDMEKAASRAVLATDELRIAFLQSLHDPDQALAMGAALLAQLKMSESQMEFAVDSYQRERDFFADELDLKEEAPIYRTLKTNKGYIDFATREEWAEYLRTHKEPEPQQGAE